MSSEPLELPSRTYPPGAIIFREGDASQGEAYLVHEGNVEVRKRIGGTERTLRRLRKGDLLGEVALFRDAAHSATAVATDDVTLLVISDDQLEQMVRTSPSLALALIRQLAKMAAGQADGGARA